MNSIDSSSLRTLQHIQSLENLKIISGLITAIKRSPRDCLVQLKKIEGIVIELLGLAPGVTFKDIAESQVALIDDTRTKLSFVDRKILVSIRGIIINHFPTANQSIKTLENLLPYGFEDVVRYLPTDDAWLTNVRSQGEAVQILCEQLAAGQWEKILVEYENKKDRLAFDALEAFSKNNISMEQFCTIIFQWSVIKDFPNEMRDGNIQRVDLFKPDGRASKTSFKILLNTLEARAFIKNQVAPLFISKNKLRFFFKAMTQKPASESSFLLIKDLSQSVTYSSQSQKINILDAIQRSGVSVFGFVDKPNRKKKRLLKKCLEKNLVLI